MNLTGYDVANGNDTFVAVYSGDINYNAGTSNGVDVRVLQTDFSLTTLNAEVAIAAGKSATSKLVLAPVNGYNGGVSLSGSGPAGVIAKFSVPTPTVSAATDDAVTISVASTVKPGSYPIVVTGNGAGHTHNTLILVTVP